VIVILVRHGETEWSRDKRHTGRTDIPLTEAGREHARLAAHHLEGRDFALVLTSPLQRARATADLAGVGDRAVEDPDLVEWDYGQYEGRSTADIRKEQPGWDIWRDGCPGGGEPLERVGERADRVIARALEAGGAVAIFAHGHILRVLGARWIGLPALGGSLLALETAAVCELGFERERHVIETWNDQSHLRGDGQPRRL
jgi:broad specificity phosphatase PhoE